MNNLFPEQAIEVLRQARHDPNATMGYEMISGGIEWSDERSVDFHVACRGVGCQYAGHVFAYRTSLLVGKPREELRFAWDEVLALPGLGRVPTRTNDVRSQVPRVR